MERAERTVAPVETEACSGDLWESPLARPGDSTPYRLPYLQWYFPCFPPAGRTRCRNTSTGGDLLPCARSWAYPDQKSFLLCNTHRESHIYQRPLGLCSLPLPVLQSTTKMWRRHLHRSVCACVQEDGT
ncbi:hypothetical protein DV515_00005221 [Chloebia gouldiae]|uniref:Uncharacterized protein n=1 Tax=Chloebia gouldiae TaxID=44316 RepID=A0A3L8SP74_CHLGU|nr:hypothetical protein DV515_00005221 [Chloebia gouldiae]